MEALESPDEAGKNGASMYLDGHAWRIIESGYCGVGLTIRHVRGGSCSQKVCCSFLEVVMRVYVEEKSARHGL